MPFPQPQPYSLRCAIFYMVEVMPNSDREVDDKDVPTILLYLLSFFISPSLPWPCGDVKPVINRVVDRVLS